jgi:hypothetical protein
LPPFGVIFYADQGAAGNGVFRDLVVGGLEPFKHPDGGTTNKRAASKNVSKAARARGEEVLRDQLQPLVAPQLWHL